MADADKDLVLQSKNGSVAAFEKLIRNHQTMIHALTFRMTGSSADAEDLAQETFIRAYEQINRFNGGAKFSTWLYSIAVHACLNWRRDEARRFQAHTNCAEEIFTQQTGVAISAAQNEMAAQAQAAIVMSFTITAAIRGAFVTWSAPDMAVKNFSGSNYNFILLAHVSVIALAGVTGNMRSFQLLVQLGGRCACNLRGSLEIFFSASNRELFPTRPRRWWRRPDSS